MRNYLKWGWYVVIYLMVGMEYSGLEVVILNLFDEKCIVLVDIDDSDVDVVELIWCMFDFIFMW